ncbi:malonate decarboxylase holo-[acyl-carrier-protein] synthase [Herbaspirillum sp. RTI4]|uniref:malonate decarboxylase holo-[acyl-carrier-protein] synthase n=1 Tax=Herbaspirillum sp. RTI4 TaxID=3048640 RepID=UPI002AB373E0|nr:malonate decarboxylase holo-[acyl-carrier-protein] synthase [Herbaspirillum sp. RTI4]MDY7580099.1 malonate decarboxylase holo-[acyl-carrier-protein] synthase [Herbaspirillum sp. RTI4]MEA9983120.1 malonate decarboxylase holo-[acyl-carrier-protein] synthase [Herbaspirillum sp. RTI4]
MFPRHNLVCLTASGWAQACKQVPAPHRPHLQRWQTEDLPAVVRRADDDADLDAVCLGIALPPDAQGDKLRIAFRVTATDIREQNPPLSIAAVITAAPTAWQIPLQYLKDEAAALQLDIRVYGSLSWQALTQDIYLRDSSDIDLLFLPRDRRQLEQGVALLTRHAEALPLDGEISFGESGAVAWKEWRQAALLPGNRVLLKRYRGVQLQRIDHLLESWEGRSCTVI